MTLPDPSLDRPTPDTGNVQDRVPTTERGQDPARTSVTHDLTTDSSRPLTDAEREAAEHDLPRGERVYAPASERVPKEPLPGHREVVEHTDPETPERHAVAEAPSMSSAEPTFTRVARPSQTPTLTTPTPSPYASSETNPGFAPAEPGAGSWSPLPSRGWAISWIVLSGAAIAGVWLYLRWQRERNRPINRFRRQARQAAVELRDRVPSSDEVVGPSIGVLAALASTVVVILRRAFAQRPDQAVRHTAETLSEADWQKRLMQLKERWTPHRLELEKISISRHHR